MTKGQGHWLRVTCVTLLTLVGSLWWSLESFSYPDRAAPGRVRSKAKVELTRRLPDLPQHYGIQQTEPAATRATQDSHSLGEESSQSVARVHGQLRDGFDAPIAAAEIRLYRGRESWETRTARDGRFEFAFEGSGQFRVFVKPNSLPAGWLAPWRQSVPRAYEGEATGFGGTSFLLAEGEELEVNLRAFRAARVSGRVSTAEGVPPSGAIVQLRSSRGVDQSSTLNAVGEFEMDAVYPGSYSAQLKPAPGVTAWTEWPMPLTITVSEGERVELRFDNSDTVGHLMRGRLVDSAGIALPGLRVIAEALDENGIQAQWQASSDEAGHFALGRLPDLQFELAVHDELGEACSGGRRSLDLSSAQATHELGEWVIELPSNFELSGRVRVDQSWARQQDLHGYTLELLTNRSSDQGGGNERKNWIDADLGEFSWNCVAPHEPVTLTVVLRGQQGFEHQKDLLVQPQARTSREVVLNFP